MSDRQEILRAIGGTAAICGGIAAIFIGPALMGVSGEDFFAGLIMVLMFVVPFVGLIWFAGKIMTSIDETVHHTPQRRSEAQEAQLREINAKIAELIELQKNLRR